VLLPLGVSAVDRQPKINIRATDHAVIEKLLRKTKADVGAPLVGLFPGAGHPTRRWPVEKFGALAEFLARNDRVRVLLFLGPEESGMGQKTKALFPQGTILLDKLTIPQLAAAQARLAVFISNDTGPMHVAAAVGTPVVAFLQKRAPLTYLPIGDRHRFISNPNIDDISVEEAYEAARAVLASSRAASLFAS
jgi:ADP-heptose:LPS heptosyltransferase